MSGKIVSPGSIDRKKKMLDVWISEGLLFVGAVLIGLGFFLVYNVSPLFTVMIAVGVLCFGFSCLGLNRLRDMIENRQ